MLLKRDEIENKISRFNNQEIFKEAFDAHIWNVSDGYCCINLKTGKISGSLSLGTESIVLAEIPAKENLVEWFRDFEEDTLKEQFLRQLREELDDEELCYDEFSPEQEKRMEQYIEKHKATEEEMNKEIIKDYADGFCYEWERVVEQLDAFYKNEYDEDFEDEEAV